MASRQQLWECLDGIDAHLGAGIARAEPRETAYRSTTRVVGGDLRRKRNDQDPERACGGPIPAGFQRFPDQEEMAEPREGRAPLVAYFRLPAEPRLATIIVVHGLYDSKHSRYVRLMAEFLAARGFGVLVPDMRWHGCLYRWLPTLGIEEGKDLIAWREWIRQRAPESPVGLVGFSLGSLDVIAATAMDTGREVFRAGGIVVSPPASLKATMSRLDDPPSLADQGALSLVRRFFLSALRRRMQVLKAAAGRPLVPARPATASGAATQPSTVRAATIDPDSERPFANFVAWLAERPPFPPGTTAAGLFDLTDPHPSLVKVRRPLLLIASRRDPIFSELALADLQLAATENPALHLIATTDGGHIGQPGRYPQWTAELFAHFFLTSPGVP